MQLQAGGGAGGAATAATAAGASPAAAAAAAVAASSCSREWSWRQQLEQEPRPERSWRPHQAAAGSSLEEPEQVELPLQQPQQPHLQLDLQEEPEAGASSAASKLEELSGASGAGTAGVAGSSRHCSWSFAWWRSSWQQLEQEQVQLELHQQLELAGAAGGASAGASGASGASGLLEEPQEQAGSWSFTSSSWQQLAAAGAGGATSGGAGRSRIFSWISAGAWSRSILSRSKLQE